MFSSGTPGVPSSALTEAGNFLNSRIRGRTLAEARLELETALATARDQQRRAEAAAELARKATDEAKAARAQAEALAAKEHAELVRTQAQMKDIDHGDLRK